jgi:hypothetical protein
MHLLFLDETNKEPTDKIRFFLYGGLFIPAEKAGDIHNGIEAARKRFGYESAALLKFDTNVRPKNVSQEDCTKLKQEVIEICFQHGCRFSVLVLHHKIASKQEPEAKFLWSSNSIIGHFNYFLSQEAKDYGVVLADRLPVKAPDQHLASIFTHGLDVDGKKLKLDRVVALGSTSIGASHLSSAIDVVLGTFRFCVNNLGDDPKIKTMLHSVARMLWYKEVSGIKYVADRGLLLRPKEIKVASYKQEYADLVAKMEALIKDV